MSSNLEFFKTLLNGLSTRINEISNITKNAILKKDQPLSDGEKTIVRDNINAASKDDVEPFTINGISSSGVNKVSIDKTFEEIQNAIVSGRVVQFRYSAGHYYVIGFNKGNYIRFGNAQIIYTLLPDTKEVTVSYPNKLMLQGNNGTYEITVNTSGKLEVFKQ